MRPSIRASLRVLSIGPSKPATNLFSRRASIALISLKNNYRAGPSAASRKMSSTRPSLPPEAEAVSNGRKSLNSYGSACPDEISDHEMMPNAKEAVTAASTDEYLESRLSHSEYAADPSLSRGKERAEEAGMPKIAVSPMQGQFLSILARGIKAEKILEIGTLGGYVSSIPSQTESMSDIL